MREIKFRAWDGRYMDYEPSIRCGCGPDVVGIANLNRGLTGVEESYRKTFMQYTGLKDKNGKEIFEGDIVVADVDVNSVRKGWKFTVNWTTGIGVGLKLYGVGKYIDNYPIDYMDIVDTYFNDQDSEIFEVIGNIYENPGLLK